jgi:hypothetical protein
MAQTFSQLVARYSGQTFQDQMLWAVLFLIRWIKFEDPGTSNHVARIMWANAAMADPIKMARSMSAMVVSDGNCTGDTAPTDSQVQSALETLVNMYTQ